MVGCGNVFYLLSLSPPFLVVPHFITYLFTQRQELLSKCSLPLDRAWDASFNARTESLSCWMMRKHWTIQLKTLTWRFPQRCRPPLGHCSLPVDALSGCQKNLRMTLMSSILPCMQCPTTQRAIRSLACTVRYRLLSHCWHIFTLFVTLLYWSS